MIAPEYDALFWIRQSLQSVRNRLPEQAASQAAIARILLARATR